MRNVVTGTLAALLLFTIPAHARTSCAPRDLVVERLASTYGETRRSIGLGAGNRMVEVFVSSETGSWTITATRPGGITCLVASGEAFETYAEALPLDDTDA
ncbi:hypothetical protein OB2597_09584 [Pseudooceanicola batsensis HTCC2597]|uniref:Uncharacterized protein n=1 Tax=Pseudooceanicola batsensis (strain ATCC BAA-863 / DSM 15984 / KCTC 12145 / HTCC2597) TaxID=252305 RepID=A3TV39_PSEBH|nr:hypothetical protein [Pseudooceanicola batsensis]EAQ04385.1 hypothetical protein OB2597_09584 [Pseudooceanicola batsensis HTCC2597]